MQSTSLKEALDNGTWGIHLSMPKEFVIDKEEEHSLWLFDQEQQLLWFFLLSLASHRCPSLERNRG